MRSAILGLSTGVEKQLISVKTVNAFLQQVKSPGLLRTEGIDTFKLAMDYAAMIRTQVEYFSRVTLLSFTKPKPITINSNTLWLPLSFAAESGALHRWRFVDYANDDAIMTELHGWELFGDLVLSGMPMTLHMVSIGRRDRDHHTSPWCKAYKAPSFNMYKFQKKSGGGLSDNWKPIYFADDIDLDPSDWVDQMIEDDVITSLISHINVTEPYECHKLNFRRDLDYEVGDIQCNMPVPWYELPMGRGACDKPFICPHQELCYSLDPKAELEGNPLYEKLK
mgnify:CR=1 FL=1